MSTTAEIVNGNEMLIATQRTIAGGVRLRLPHEFKGKARPVSLPPESVAFEPLNVIAMNRTTLESLFQSSLGTIHRRLAQFDFLGSFPRLG